MNVLLASESLLLIEQVQRQVVSLKSSEMYLYIDIKYVSVITKGGSRKNELGCSRKNELRNAMYCRNSVHLWGYG